MTARHNVMDVINPVDAFNAYNMSMSFAPKPINDHIISASKKRATYVRDGIRCYTSLTMHKELYLTSGILFKEPVQKARLKDSYYRQYVALDFARH